FTLPARPAGFPASGRFYVHLIVNSTSSVVEADRSDNFSQPIPVQVARRALPNIVATGLNLPEALGPGDTIAPTITLSNNVTAPSGPGEVALAASTTKNFNVGSSIVPVYQGAPTPPPASAVAPGGIIAAFSQTANPVSNSLTFTGPLVTLPTSPAKYFLGL